MLYPIPITWFSSYGCKYELYPGIFSSPLTSGFVGSDKSITNNGSICLNVTIYPTSPINLAE